VTNLQNIINATFKKVAVLCLFTLLAMIVVADDDWKIKVNGRVTEDKEKLEGVVVSLINNSRLMQEIITSGNGKFVFVLKPGNDYLIEVAKPGYASKSIAFSTKNVPQENVRGGFPDFPIEIVLYQEIEGVNTAVLDNPVGKIIYSASADDFTIDMQYYKSVKADLARLNKDMKMALARAKKEQRMNEEELVENDNNYYTTPNGESGNSIIPEIVVEANNLVREKSVQWSDRQGVGLFTGLELLEQKRSRIREELDYLPASLVSVNTYKDGAKEILIRIVHRTDIYTEYKRVIQSWGPRFYFKDDIIITEHLFQLESDLEALLESKTFKF